MVFSVSYIYSRSIAFHFPVVGVKQQDEGESKGADEVVRKRVGVLTRGISVWVLCGFREWLVRVSRGFREKTLETRSPQISAARSTREISLLCSTMASRGAKMLR